MTLPMGAANASHGQTEMAGGLTSTEREDYDARGHMAPSRRLSTALIAPARQVVRDLAATRPWQDMLSGIHNPFGYHACPDRAWLFLDIAESAELLDAVAAVLGPDIVLWDSELHFDAELATEEAEFWPVEPLVGTIALVGVEQESLLLVDIARLAHCRSVLPLPAGPVYVLRYMSARSHFNRDPLFAPNRRIAEARPLINYAKRPLWLVRGEDRGGNDFDTGFSVRVGQWTTTNCFGLGPPEQSHDRRILTEGE
jgi:hypothetical protein